MSVWFITGAARGFGRELAAAALAQGDQVFGTARDPQSAEASLGGPNDSLFTTRLDVTDEANAREAVKIGVDRFGRIDVLVNNAGYGSFGSVEETSDAEVRALFDTNVFGLLNVTRAALPTLREQAAGHIINISSSAGFAVSAGRGLYGASKFAVQAITEAPHAELKTLGGRVTAVEPGSFRTGFLTPNSVHRVEVGIPSYAGTVGALHAGIEAGDGNQPGDPVKAAAAILRHAASAEPPLRLQLGSDCVALVEDKLRSVAGELDLWRTLALSTDFAQS